VHEGQIQGLLATIQSRISSKQCVANPSHTTIFMAMASCLGQHRPSSGHFYKNIAHRIKYSAVTIHPVGSHMCYSSHYV